jgi:hypothetical protein
MPRVTDLTAERMNQSPAISIATGDSGDERRATAATQHRPFSGDLLKNAGETLENRPALIP